MKGSDSGRPPALRLIVFCAIAALSNCWGVPSINPALPANSPNGRPEIGARGYAVVYQFRGGSDGANPAAALTAYKGVLYGTTFAGGSGGNGTVYALIPSGRGFQEHVLHAFANPPDGARPEAPVTARRGVLFGTTAAGGANHSCGYYSYPPSPYVSCGTAFKIVLHTRKESVISDFSSGGWKPLSGFLFTRGRLVGTTQFIGVDNQCLVASSVASGCGLVYELIATGAKYAEKVIHSFDPGSAGDGAYPAGNLVADTKGNIFGTTLLGGSSAYCSQVSGAQSGCGTVYMLSPSASGYSERVLYSFNISGTGRDGAAPSSGLTANAGALYGTTFAGGDATCSATGYSSGCGVVYMLRRSGIRYVEHVVYAFPGGARGMVPIGSVVALHGSYYGTTQSGGSGHGVVFRLSRTASGFAETVLHAFSGGSDGAQPQSGLIYFNGRLFGTTANGGNPSCKNGCGTIYELNP